MKTPDMQMLFDKYIATKEYCDAAPFKIIWSFYFYFLILICENDPYLR